MLLKFKNKHILAIDKMIKEAEAIKGIIERIEVDPKEAAGLINEIINLGKDYVSIITIINRDGEDITLHKLLWNNPSIDKTEQIKSIIQKWYKTQYTVTYNTAKKEKIKMRIVKPVPDVPKPTELPVSSGKTVAGWSEPVLEAEHKADKSQIINSWKAHDDLPPITKQFMDERATPSPPSPPPPPPARSVTGKEVPAPPPFPPNRLIVSEPWVGRCDICGSSKKTKWVFFDTGKCIQPECENYWKNK